MANEPVSKVLLVDDDLALRTAVKFSLELEGFEVEAFDSAEALLMREIEPGPTCLVLDQKLPGLSGLAALAQLRAQSVDLPALLITSHPNQLLRTAAANAGVGIVEKPLIGDTLVDSIRRVLGDKARL